MQITTAKSGTYIAHKMILHIKSMFFSCLKKAKTAFLFQWFYFVDCYKNRQLHLTFDSYGTSNCSFYH